jgi:hypothetical protein
MEPATERPSAAATRAQTDKDRISDAAHAEAHALGSAMRRRGVMGDVEGYYYKDNEPDPCAPFVSVLEDDRAYARARDWMTLYRQAITDYRNAIDAFEQGRGSFHEVEAARATAEWLAAHKPERGGSESLNSRRVPSD